MSDPAFGQSRVRAAEPEEEYREDTREKKRYETYIRRNRGSKMKVQKGDAGYISAQKRGGC